MNSQEFSDRLQSLTETTKPRKKTAKQIIRENIETIEKALAKGWNYDDIAAKLNSKTFDDGEEISITVATLRKYCYEIRKERENNNRN